MKHWLKVLATTGLALMLTGTLAPTAWASGTPVKESADADSFAAGRISTIMKGFSSKIQNIDNYDAATLSVLAEAAATEVTPGWNELGTCEWQKTGSVMVIRPIGGGSVGELPDISYGQFGLDNNYSDYRTALRAGGEEVEIVGRVMCDRRCSLFYDCPSLVSIKGLEHLDVSNVDSMNSMFWGCSSLMSLDLSSFDTSNVVTSGWAPDGGIFGDGPEWHGVSMFEGALLEAGAQIRLGNGFTFNLSEECCLSGRWKNEAGVIFQAAEIPAGASGTYTRIDGETRPSGDDRDPAVDNSDNLVVEIAGGMLDKYEPGVDWTGGKKSECTMLVVKEKISLPVSSEGMFADFTALQSVQGFGNLDTSNVTKMDSMFEGCAKLTALDLSSFDTSKVVSAKDMFKDSGLRQIRLGKNFTLNLEECALPYEVWENENGERFTRASIPTGVEGTNTAVVPDSPGAADGANGANGSNADDGCAGSGPAANGGGSLNGANQPGGSSGSGAPSANQTSVTPLAVTGDTSPIAQTGDGALNTAMPLVASAVVSLLVLVLARRSLRRCGSK